MQRKMSCKNTKKAAGERQRWEHRMSRCCCRGFSLCPFVLCCSLPEFYACAPLLILLAELIMSAP
uniref:Uncharacterized protein n=1 Tax=Triticum urartu TaxID=4572 RepID=A0A8R7TBP3_TRIUA